MCLDLARFAGPKLSSASFSTYLSTSCVPILYLLQDSAVIYTIVEHHLIGEELCAHVPSVLVYQGQEITFPCELSHGSPDS